MASTLSIGTSALLTAQGGLNTTSHNISNVNTEGYSRQRIEQSTRIPEYNGNQYFGTGVQVDDVRRLFDGFLSDQLRLFTSQEEQFDTFTTYSQQVEDLLASDSLSLANGLESFFDSVQAVADDPTSISARQVMLTEADTLANRFNTIDSQLDAFNSQVNLNLQSSVDDVNSLIQGIAELNVAITEAKGGTGATPNDLLDRRDKLVNDLSELVSVTTVEQSNGSVNVFIGTGQPVVVGATTNQLSTIFDPNDSSRLQIGLGPNQVDISAQVTGGKLGGLLRVRSEVIDVTRAEIDTLASSMIETFNSQHKTGLTLDGVAGGNFFGPTNPAVPPVPDAGTIRVALTDPRDIAIAFPVQLGSTSGNTGTGGLNIDSIDSSGVGFNAASALSSPLTFSFDNTTNTYTVTYGAGNTATISYDPAVDSGKSFDLANLTSPPNTPFPGALPPLTITLDGVPANGDSFVINNSTAGGFNGFGDNRNALALAELQVAKTMKPNGSGTPTQSFGDAYGILVANVATRTKQAQVGQETQQGLLDQTKTRFDSVSGVNLDEEAASLIKYQQTYQAAAQIITVSNTIFDTLINSF
ncbi:Flagellar hook-associated protein FlgK [Methylophaga thiooxydans]|uniref:Flagellar hook-associated protein 1 n=1 Tax=Methylophaga thiooxydans TaxID=392484 RepID=A0A0A0BK05_9GAMM|nr:flagellar hook-associated protein FlgK [Methylophaga thiooxydans]KGM08190.1 Flagellar hook-associated protein FlgK [Methylophaga thiooxydans]